ncbi:hypothetical protein KHQ06_24105 [Nocardia tengchongensis]|uniref:SAV-6107-like HEPN domain-containing protein n=1 Tax=Nocardia tengchongensis TaxID=2055889 RepID=A0ABX8CJ67_9NOCA|nr:hypothetical protein [Nocardia tengchongensis]QVI19452.1 hypothetical protein KHQ06_24105 [Nocardia tengchongensis]
MSRTPIDGAAPADSLSAVPLPYSALGSGSLAMAQQAHRVNTDLRAVTDATDQAVHALDRFRRFLSQWRILVLRHRMRARIGDLLDPIDADLSAGGDWMELLYTLGREFRSAPVTLDTAMLREQLTRIERAAAAGY